MFLDDVGVVMVDEVDTMLETGFRKDVVDLLHPLLYGGGVVELSMREGMVLKEGAP